MAELLGFQFNAGSTVDGILFGLLIVAIGLLVMGVIWAILEMMKYKYKVRVRDVVKGRTVVRDDKAKIWLDKDGNAWWKFLKIKAKIPEPPSDCVDIDTKGNKILEVYRTSDGAIIPIKDSFNYERFLHEKADEFQPLTRQQRALLIDEIRKSQAYSKTKGLHEVLAQAIPYIALVLILTVTLLFWGEAMSPAIELGNTMNGVTSNLQAVTNDLEKIMSDSQYIEGDEVNQGTVQAPN